MHNSTDFISATSNVLLQKIRDEAPSFLTKTRLEHVLSVETQMMFFSDLFLPVLGLSHLKNDLLASALLHDITKKYDEPEHLKLYKKYKIKMSAIEFACPEIWHARTGAFLAKQLFSVNNRIFNAIYYHTTARENMSLFEKLLFVADFIEQNRKHKACINTFNYFYENLSNIDNKNSKSLLQLLDDTVLFILNQILSNLIFSNNVIYPDTINARNFLMLNKSYK